jgi:hypothetical protein
MQSLMILVVSSVDPFSRLYRRGGLLLSLSGLPSRDLDLVVGLRDFVIGLSICLLTKFCRRSKRIRGKLLAFEETLKYLSPFSATRLLLNEVCSFEFKSGRVDWLAA